MLAITFGTAYSTIAKSSYPNRSFATKIIQVPLCRQATEYTCGVAALQSIFAFYGEDIREELLAKQLGSNEKNGTSHKNIAKLAKAKGYEVNITEQTSIEKLKSILNKGNPVICLIQAWAEKKVDYKNDWDNGHYVVAIGYDNKNIYFMDPATIGNYTYIPIQEFLTRWHDKEGSKKILQFAMVITKDKTLYKANEFKPLN
jgi:predicted double-glycine peptidase